MPDDDVEALASRPGWIVDGPVATYQPEPGNWCAQVRRILQPARAAERWNIAIRDPHGRVQYVEKATSIGEAARVAEGHVRGKLR